MSAELHFQGETLLFSSNYFSGRECNIRVEPLWITHVWIIYTKSFETVLNYFFFHLPNGMVYDLIHIRLFHHRVTLYILHVSALFTFSRPQLPSSYSCELSNGHSARMGKSRPYVDWILCDVYCLKMLNSYVSWTIVFYCLLIYWRQLHNVSVSMEWTEKYWVAWAKNEWCSLLYC